MSPSGPARGPGLVPVWSRSMVPLAAPVWSRPRSPSGPGPGPSQVHSRSGGRRQRQCGLSPPPPLLTTGHKQRAPRPDGSARSQSQSQSQPQPQPQSQSRLFIGRPVGRYGCWRWPGPARRLHCTVDRQRRMAGRCCLKGADRPALVVLGRDRHQSVSSGARPRRALVGQLCWSVARLADRTF